jgi:hypothetical protein
MQHVVALDETLESPNLTEHRERLVAPEARQLEPAAAFMVNVLESFGLAAAAVTVGRALAPAEKE